jgi:integrase
MQPTHPDIAWFLDESDWTAANRRNAVSLLNRWHSWLDSQGVALHDATTALCRAFLAERGQSVAPSTNRLDWRFLRAFYAWAANPASEGGAELIARSPMTGVKAPRVPEGARQATATAEDYDKLIAACKGSRDPHRNRAMIALMFRGGLRASEVLALDLDHVDLGASVPTAYIAKPKNGRPRTVPLIPEVVLHLRRYLRHRLGGTDGPLFTGTSATADRSGRLTYSAMRSMLRRVGADAGVTLSSHSFRRGMATDYLARGGQQVNLQRICGWSDARMVARYANARLDEIAAAELMSMHADVTETRRSRRRVATAC